MPEHEADDRKSSAKKTGKFIFANGDVFEGQYELNQSNSIERHGNGTVTCKNGVIYSGTWVNDKLNGKGTYIHPSGCKYEGDFLNGKFDGVGRYEWPDGSHYEGEFKNSKLEGKGYFKDPTGQIWTGKFQGDSASRLRFRLNM